MIVADDLALTVPSGAIFSDDGQYRYRLWRQILPTLGQDSGGTVMFVLLNPSTAGAAVNDPTVRRCLGFAERWGYTRLEILNAFALRAVNPEQLDGHPDPVGPETDGHLVLVARQVQLIVCGWGGTHRRFQLAHLASRVGLVAGLLHRIQPLHALGVTQHGDPVHPLYHPYSEAVTPALWAVP